LKRLFASHSDTEMSNGRGRKLLKTDPDTPMRSRSRSRSRASSTLTTVIDRILAASRSRSASKGPAKTAVKRKSSGSSRKPSTRKRARTTRRKSNKKNTKFMKLYKNINTGIVSKEVFDLNWFNVSGNTPATPGSLNSAQNNLGVYAHFNLPYAEFLLEEVIGQDVTTGAGPAKWGIFQAPSVPVYTITNPAGLTTSSAFSVRDNRECFLIKSYKSHYTFSNVGNVPCDIWAYEFLCTDASLTAPYENMIARYTDQQVFQGTNKPLTAPTTLNYWSSIATQGKIKSVKGWKMQKMAHWKLKPEDDDVHFTVNQKNMIFDNAQQRLSDDNSAPTYCKGITTCVMVVTRGVVGVSTTATTGIPGYTGCSVGCINKQTLKACRVSDSRKQRRTVIYDDTSMAAMSVGFTNTGALTGFGAGLCKTYEENVTQYP